MQSKLKDVLGAFPLPVEVIPLARSLVGRELVKLGGHPRLREGFVTDYGNIILDVHGLTILDPMALEDAINQIPGVVTNGLFARRPADLLLLGTAGGRADPAARPSASPAGPGLQRHCQLRRSTLLAGPADSHAPW